MRKIILTVLFITVSVTFFASCNLLGEKNENPAIPGKLVFSSPDENGRYQIYTSNTDGSDRKQLTYFKNDEAFTPTWSNDGSQIAFTTTLQSSSAGASLYLMNADGSNIRPLKERPESNIVTPGNNPAWSPDDSKIAFDWCTNCELGGNNYEIYVYDFKKDTVFEVTNHPANDDYPTWNPSGSSLAFSSGREYYNDDTLKFRKDLYKVDLKNITKIQRLTKTGFVTKPLWNPLEEMIIYEWNIRENKIYKINLSSKIISEIKTGLEYSGSPQISNKGSKLIAFGRYEDSSTLEIRFYELTDGTINQIKKQPLSNPLRRAKNIKWYYDENKL